jgi:hypothetical protein
MITQPKALLHIPMSDAHRLQHFLAIMKAISAFKIWDIFYFRFALSTIFFQPFVSINYPNRCFAIDATKRPYITSLSQFDLTCCLSVVKWVAVGCSYR